MEADNSSVITGINYSQVYSYLFSFFLTNKCSLGEHKTIFPILKLIYM